jgi:hypothetical protein
MNPRICSKTLILSLFGGALLAGWSAMGQVQFPVDRFPAAIEFSKGSGSRISRSSTNTSLQRLRPVQKNEPVNFDDAERFLSDKTALEKIYDKDMEQRFRNEYRDRVLPNEKLVTNPYRRARSWEMAAYDQKRNEMARWAAKEVVNDQVKEYFSHSDKNAAPLKIMHTMKELSGEGDDKAEEKLTPAEKAARAHRRDLPVKTVAEEQDTPTKLKTKLNVINRRGQLLFTNPIATTSLNVKAGRGDDNFVLEMAKEFRKLDLASHFKYAIDQQLMTLNLRQRITNEVSLNVDSEHHTGQKRGDQGEKSRETAQLLYNVSF